MRVCVRVCVRARSPLRQELSGCETSVGRRLRAEQDTGRDATRHGTQRARGVAGPFGITREWFDARFSE